MCDHMNWPQTLRIDNLAQRNETFGARSSPPTPMSLAVWPPGRASSYPRIPSKQSVESRQVSSLAINEALDQSCGTRVGPGRCFGSQVCPAPSDNKHHQRDWLKGPELTHSVAIYWPTARVWHALVCGDDKWWKEKRSHVQAVARSWDELRVEGLAQGPNYATLQRWGLNCLITEPLT